MKKSVIVIIFAIIALSCAGAYAYYYYFVQTVTNYFVLTYTPPQERNYGLAGIDYTDPKIEIEQTTDYEDDKTAREIESQKAKESFDYYFSELEKLAENSTAQNDIQRQCEVNALTDLLQQQYFLIRITHIRKYSVEESLDVIRKHWGNHKELKDFAEKNKLSFEIYTLNHILGRDGI